MRLQAFFIDFRQKLHTMLDFYTFYINKYCAIEPLSHIIELFLYTYFARERNGGFILTHDLAIINTFVLYIGFMMAIGVYYYGDAITMIDDNPDLAWVFPEEGSVLSVDCMAVPATSEHKEAAEMFINFMCEPDIGKANAEYIGYTTPMQKVWDILDEDLRYSEIAYPSEEVEAKEKVFTALSDEVNNELDVKWSEMKSYDEGGSGVVFLMLLLAMVALACFNIWRKLRKKTRNQY